MKTAITLLALTTLLVGCVHVYDHGTSPTADQVDQKHRDQDGNRFGDIFQPQGTVTVTGTITAVTTVGTITNAVGVSSITTSVTPGTSAAHLGKAEDAVAGSGDTGVLLLTRRIDTEASSADTSGDYGTADTDAKGRWRIVPGQESSTTYASAVTSASTWTGGTITTSAYRTACFTWLLTNTTNPVGTLEIDGSIDGTSFHPIYIDANKISYYIGSTYTAFTGGTTIAINDPAGNVKIGACVEAIYPAMRLVYTRTSGGAVSTINSYYSLRAN